MNLANAMWAVTAAAIVGTLANCHKKRWGFVVWMVTNSLLTAYNVYIGEWAQAALWATYVGIAVYGWVQWGKGGRDA